MIRHIFLLLLLGALNGFAQQTNQGSLTHRFEDLTRLAAAPQTSHWHTVTIDGTVIGGHQCPGQDTALRGPDYGTMWSVAALTDQSVIRNQLAAARNFKLKQLDPAPGFFQGAPLGDHYLPAAKRFASAHPQVTPADLAEAIQDLGNVLLFAPNDTEVRDRLQLAAERLLAWQHDDGRWDAAYDRTSQRATTNAPAEFRPTFYGLLAAHRVLNDAKYLAAAKRGADWFISHPPGTNLTAYAKQALFELSRATHSTTNEWANNVPPDESTTPPCPRHWTQIGSLLNYLLTEARLRSGQKIDFPRGLMGSGGSAPPYGFAPGTIYGEPSFLKLPPGLITTDSSNLEYLSALAIRGNRLFVIAMNNSGNALTAKLKIAPDRLLPGKTVRWVQGRPLAGGARPLDPFGNWEVELPPNGLAVIQLAFQ